MKQAITRRNYVGASASPAFMGGALVSADNRIDEDELGLTTARNTGARVADFALKLANTAS